MKDTRIAASLDIEVLRFVRDSRPTELDLLGWLGPRRSTVYHVLRQAGLLVKVEDDRIVLSPTHLSANGQTFRWKHMLFFLDTGEVWTF